MRSSSVRCGRISFALPAIFAALSILFQPAPASAQRAAPEAPTRHAAEPGAAASYMVAAAHPLAVRAGRDVLRQGGTAMDAAVAVQMVLNLVEPQSSGIGGGGFLLYWDSGRNRLYSYDGRETAPMGADETLFLKEDGAPMAWPDAVGTARSVGVPGLVSMLAKAQGTHGRLGWGPLFGPAISLARDGFGVSPRLSSLLAGMGADRFPPEARAYFFDADGAPRPLGHVLRNPALADTLQTVAEGGADAFYKGAVAERIVAALKAAPGPQSAMTEADISAYEAKARAPVCVPYRGITLCGMGPPSSGGLTVSQTLGLLDRFDLGAQPSPPALHLIMEAEKLAYADRNRYLADPDHATVPEGLLDPAYLDERARLIDPVRPMVRAEPGYPPWTIRTAPGRDGSREAPGTTHISIIDGEGNVAALTSSIETAFGSRIMVGGFLLNNQLTDFSFTPKDEEGRPVANRPGPGKRPRSSMAPTILFGPAGRPLAALGSPGGSRIILYVLKTVIAMADWGMTPQQAAALANFGSRNGPAEVEEGAAGDLPAAGLAALGHTVTRPAMTSGLHIVARRGGGLSGGADPRREGAVLGE